MCYNDDTRRCIMIDKFFDLWESYAIEIIIGILIIWLILSISLWGIFRKVNQKPWKAFVPLYQLFPLMIITDTPIFFVALLFLPFVNILAILFVSYRLGIVFEQKGIMKYGLIICPLIFYPILGLCKFPYKPSEQVETENIDTNILYNQMSNTPITDVLKETTTSLPNVPLPNQTPKATLESESKAPTLSNIDEKIDIIDIDNEDETWNDVKKTEEEVKKVVNINPLDNDPLFNPKAKPIKQGDLEHYKICPQCGAKLAIDATTCFLCGNKVG